ncbi:hypothetical protein [Embleya scabrispora]|uniref:hypothetical protein n=1 Tax=Embleya scabrispora TaxID=159449 RepID=UPI000368A4F4|nr:hypothetical protein [Embleya scabrispora]MYS82772.1 hypothetical protein [Streptomyces sp. SID5474]
MGSPRSEEQELATAMRTAASELVLPAGLVAGGITRGRRMRRARRIRMGASVVAVLAVAGTGLVVSNGTQGTPGTRDASGAAAVAGDSTSPSAGPGPEAESHVPVGREPVSAQEIARILLQTQWMEGRQVEPKGATLPPKTDDSTNRVGAFASILLDNTDGFTRLSAQVRSSTPESSGSACSEATKLGGICRPFAGPDGTRGYVAEYMSFRGSTVGGSGQPSTGPGALSRSVWLTRPDGVEISLTATTERAAGGVVGAAVPLALDRLKAAALSSVWQLWVSPEVNRAAREKVAGFEDQAAKPNPYTSGSGTPSTTFPPVHTPSPPVQAP